MAHLFSPLQIGPVRVDNRIVVSPMCQYSADDGCASEWHLHHLVQMGISGAGLVMVEATAVERPGRITHNCLGLYSDANERALARVVAAIRASAPKATKLGIQLAHAGRKGSAQVPWQGGRPLTSREDPWLTVAPSAIPAADGWPVPRALEEDEIEQIVDAFAAAAVRAVRLGFDVIELHMAHGYLIHEFQSPLSNRRTDRFGGSPEKRAVLASEIAVKVRANLPDRIALGARITGTDWVDGGLGSDDAVALARTLKRLGAHYVDVSSAGITQPANIPLKPGYQVAFAARVRKETGILTRAVGLIVEPFQADDIIAGGDADQIAMARAFLDNPRWPWHAAEKLEFNIERPPQYARSAPKLWPGAKMAHREKIVA
jgi:2,4-dienoyl-CoA reductase-like NADH-dependent reductase (Old Yellow Enzyme family)